MKISTGISMSSEIAALEELKGRCQAIQIVWLDTGVRMQVRYPDFHQTYKRGSKTTVTASGDPELAEEILDLRQYLVDVRDKYPEVGVSSTPLLGSVTG
jgi:hypothetical protein